MKCLICRTSEDCQIIDQDSERLPDGILEAWRTWECSACGTRWDEWGDPIWGDTDIDEALNLEWDNEYHEVSFGEKSDEIEQTLMKQDEENARWAIAQQHTIPMFGKE